MAEFKCSRSIYCVKNCVEFSENDFLLEYWIWYFVTIIVLTYCTMAKMTLIKGSF